MGDETVIKSVENFFLDGDSSKMFLEYKTMLGSDNLDLIGGSCLKLMQFMQLGKCEKGQYLWRVSSSHCKCVGLR